MRYVTPSALFAVGTLAAVFFFWMRYISAAQNSPVELQWVRGEDDAPLAFAGRCHPMEKSDRLPVLLITVIYALTAFFQLGDLTAPQETYDFSAGSTALIRVEGEAVYTTGFRYYSGLGTGSYNIEISADGEHWSTLWQRKDDPEDTGKVTGYFFADAEGYPPNYALTQKYNQLYKWIDVTVENPQYVRYLRITGKADKEVLELSRLCLLGQDGQPVRFNWTGTEAERFPQLFLVDETVPDRSTWHNSTYFDEIYHARTAKEHIDGVYPYEVTHPPLGKLLMGIGIRLFGMTPFGWRFTGTLFGVLMLPILYVFLKNMFRKTAVAACGTILFAAEFMHLTQTRIATIDTYGVFFILLMYFFMYRYLTLPAGTSFAKGTLPLFLSGLFWGRPASGRCFMPASALPFFTSWAFTRSCGTGRRMGRSAPAPGRPGHCSSRCCALSLSPSPSTPPPISPTPRPGKSSCSPTATRTALPFSSKMSGENSPLPGRENLKGPISPRTTCSTSWQTTSGICSTITAGSPRPTPMPPGGSTGW